MRYPLILKLIPLCLAMMVITPGLQAEDEHEEKVALRDLPKQVLQTARNAVSGFVAKEAEKETKNGQVIYEIEGEANGVKYEISVSADGKLIKVEQEDADDDDDDDDK